MAVERVREGEDPSTVIASYGFCRTTIYKWLRAASGRGKGLRALASRKATGRPRTLTAAQERQVFRWINGKDPRQYGFDFALWTRKVVGAVDRARVWVRLGVTAVGKLLAQLGLTPQKPLQRAYQRDPEAIARWQRETYPRLAKDGQGPRCRTSTFGMSRASAPMACRVALGACKARPRWWPCPASGNRYRRPRRSMPVAPSGLPLTHGALNAPLFIDYRQAADETSQEAADADSGQPAGPQRAAGPRLC